MTRPEPRYRLHMMNFWTQPKNSRSWTALRRWHLEQKTDGWQVSFYESLAMREVGAEKVNQVLLGKEAFDDEGFVSAAEKMNELYTAGVLGESPLEDGEAEANAKFPWRKGGHASDWKLVCKRY